MGQPVTHSHSLIDSGMDIKRTVIPALLALMAVSCTRGEPVPVQRSTVTFSAGVPVKGSDAEVSALDVLVFRPDGSLDAYGRAEGTTLSLDLTDGMPLRWLMAANVPSASALSSVRTEKDLLALASPLEDSGKGTMVMSASGTVESAGAAGTVSAQLTRLASKVTLRRIDPQYLRGESHGEVKLSRVFLTNVMGSCPYTAEPWTAGPWLNRGGWDASLPDGLKAMLGTSPSVILDGSPAEGPWSLTASPNPVDNGVWGGGEWTPRNTRLVVELTEDGRPVWYPVTLPPMECGTEYIITEARLTGPGSDDPDTPVGRMGISVSLTLRTWDGQEHQMALTDQPG